MKYPNVLCLRDNILYFCGFSLLKGQSVSIQYSRNGAPIVISSTGAFPNAICSFPLKNHTCSDNEAIRFFKKRGSLDCVFAEIDNRYIQLPNLKVELTAKDIRTHYGFTPDSSHAISV